MEKLSIEPDLFNKEPTIKKKIIKLISIKDHCVIQVKLYKKKY